ncbi:MAG: hypothetical protein PHG05_02455 [Candidatus Nanoarchaeia archaeon]|nr:hypothetical protein [Candidatus Nanoarchaeia archaeon]
MNKKIIFILLALIIIPFVAAEFNICFSEGEEFSFCNPATNYYRCGNYIKCACQADGHNCGPICMKEYKENKKCFNQGNPGLCQQSGTCLPGSSGNFDQQAPIITLISPKQDLVYDSRSVLFNITLDEAADVYYYDNINGRGRWSKIASSKTSVSKKISLKDGLNDLTIKAVDEHGNEANKTVSFFIDSKKPVIKRTYPSKGKYATGEFIIEYSEENVREITLYINGNQIQKKTDCPSDSRSASCTFNVDLTPYNGQDISYDFKIKDLVTEVSLKTPVTVKVDTVFPNLQVIYPVNNEIYNKYVPFNLVVSEASKLQYRDNSASRPTWKTLCSKCIDYDKVKSFSRGVHNVDIQATDIAGNSVAYNYDFTVNY